MIGGITDWIGRSSVRGEARVPFSDGRAGHRPTLLDHVDKLIRSATQSMETMELSSADMVLLDGA